MLTKRKKQDIWLTQAQYDALQTLEDGVVYHITDAKVDYSTEVSNRPILKTDNTTAQSTSASETITGTINLHKVAKTGTYTDLLSKPTLGTAAAKDAGTQNGVADLDANGKVPFNELPLDALTGSSAPTTSTAADYVGQWYLDTTNSKTYQCTAITSNGGTPPTYTYTWVEMARASSISGKVDKTSSINQVYGTDGSGNQTTYLLTTNAIADAVPKYSADKRLKTDDPSAYNDAANKNYVDTNFAKLDASNLSSTNITSFNSTLGSSQLVAEVSLTTAASSITISNLDMNADGGHYFVIATLNGSSSPYNSSLQFNGVTSDYVWSQLGTSKQYSSGAGEVTPGGWQSTGASGIEIPGGAYSNTLVLIDIMRDSSSKILCSIRKFSVGDYMGSALAGGMLTTGQVNLTSLTITASSTQFGVGTRIKIYKYPTNTATRPQS